MRIVFLVSAFIISVSAVAQDSVGWIALADVNFTEKYDKSYGTTLLIADYADHIKELDGREVAIEGYLIPIDPMGTAYVLSRNPNASCFFCGGAGPESIVGLRLKPKAIKRYPTDTYKRFKGTFKANKSNAAHFHYMLLDAEEY